MSGRLLLTLALTLASKLVVKTTALGTTHDTYDRLGRLTEVGGPGSAALWTETDGNRAFFQERCGAGTPGGFYTMRAREILL